MIYILIICLIIIGFLLYKLNQKQQIDQNELETYNTQLLDARAEKKLLDEQVQYEKHKLDECKKDLQVALDTYNDVVDNKMKEIDNIIMDTQERRMN